MLKGRQHILRATVPNQRHDAFRCPKVGERAFTLHFVERVFVADIKIKPNFWLVLTSGWNTSGCFSVKLLALVL